MEGSFLRDRISIWSVRTWGCDAMARVSQGLRFRFSSKYPLSRRSARWPRATPFNHCQNCPDLSYSIDPVAMIMTCGGSLTPWRAATIFFGERSTVVGMHASTERPGQPPFVYQWPGKIVFPKCDLGLTGHQLHFGKAVLKSRGVV